MRPQIADPDHAPAEQPRGRPLIIERPDLQTRAQRLGYLSVTFICWFLWLYLFVPLLSFLAWALGATLVYQIMLQNLDTSELLRLMRAYGSGIGILGTVYVVWAFSSFLRFRHVDRRNPPPQATDDDVAASHGLNLQELEALRHGRRLVVSAAALEQMFSPASPPAGLPEAANRLDPSAEEPEARRASG